MNYFLYKWHFTTPVHFGRSNSALSLYGSNMNICADTLFSALCHTALEMGGEERLSYLVTEVQSGRLKLSDTFPWKKDEFYLPKPLYRPAKERKDVDLPSGTRKAMKKLNWIPISAMSSFTRAIDEDELFPAQDVDQDFGQTVLNEKAAVRTGGEANPYQVGTFYFKKDAGLYCFAAVENEKDGDELTTLLEETGLGGIGGKRTSGLGKFDVIDTILLNEPFDDTTQYMVDSLTDHSSAQMLLTTSLPEDDELERAIDGASYLLMRRGGFVQSEKYSKEMRKKQVQYYFQAGSVFKNTYRGDVYNVGSPNGGHPVYRYSVPIFWGVKL